MSTELALLRDNIRTLGSRAIMPHLEALERAPAGVLPAAPFQALDELELQQLDLMTADERRMLAAALGALAESSAAMSALAFADAAARLLAGSSAPGGRGACPVYTELEASDPRPRVAEGRLQGRHEMLVGAPVAAWLLVPAMEDGVCKLAVVASDAEGVVMGDALRTLGMHGCPTADVVFRDAPCQALAACDPARIELLRGPACAIGAALAKTSHATALAYAMERVQGGRAIVEHPEVRRMLADMSADAALCRHAADALCDEPGEVGLFIRAREAAARATCDGVQLLGGYGYMEDCPQARRMRDARQASYLLGRGEVLRQRTAAL